MSHYIRYVLFDAQPVTLEELNDALRAVNSTCTIDAGVLTVDQAEVAAIDVTRRGDPVCDGDLDLLTRLAERKKRRVEIQAALRRATGMVCVQPLNTLRPQTDELLAPLLDWLTTNRAGLLALEGGRFFDRVHELT